jgi:hypothetical protein
MFQEIQKLTASDWTPFGLNETRGPLGLVKTVELTTSGGTRRQDIYLTYTQNSQGDYSPAFLMELDYPLLKDAIGSWLALELAACDRTASAIPVEVQQTSKGALLCSLAHADVNEIFHCFLSDRDLVFTLHAPDGPVVDFSVPTDPTLLYCQRQVAAALDMRGQP